MDGTLQSAPEAFGAGLLRTTTEFADFELRVECRAEGSSSGTLFVRCPPDVPVKPQNAYAIRLDNSDKRWPAGSIEGIARARGGSRTTDGWTEFIVRAEGDRLSVRVADKPAVNVRNTKHARGAIAIGYNGKGTLRIRNVRLRPLRLKSLFNGKDLTGWKPIPGRRSVFSVTPEGWLSVKGGNGDLQTESEWGDFVLQMQIMTNGEHLNSGIFFRANPGVFWSGYESQIRNQWQDDDRTRPVDFGTGGLYGRQPARRVVSNDREWFTKTIIAHGFHIAIWVNGYQVVDFTDTRSVNENNARAGARSRAGVISIQGHDPSTDLLFRNIQIIELPPRKQ